MRLTQKWLKAGVLEQGEPEATDQTTPQGAPISALLANLYSHHVLDLWAHDWRKHQAKGELVLAR